MYICKLLLYSYYYNISYAVHSYKLTYTHPCTPAIHVTGSSRLALNNMRSLEKTLALELDEDDDDEEEGEGEELSADEINQLTGGKSILCV